MDCDFVQLLLVSFVHVDFLKEMQIEKDVLDLIKGICFNFAVLVSRL